MTTTATLPAQTLRAALASTLPATSRDRTLPILASVRIEIGHGEVKALATDRHIMARHLANGDSVTTEGEGGITLGADDAKQLLAAIPKPNRYTQGVTVALTIVEGDRLVAETPNATLTYAGVDGEYPSIERLLTDYNDPRIDGRFGLSPIFMESIAKCVKGLGIKSPAIVFSGGENANKPIGLTVETAPEWSGLIMPMRLAN